MRYGEDTPSVESYTPSETIIMEDQPAYSMYEPPAKNLLIPIMIIGALVAWSQL